MKVSISPKVFTQLSCALNMILVRPRPIFYMITPKLSGYLIKSYCPYKEKI